MISTTGTSSQFGMRTFPVPPTVPRSGRRRLHPLREKVGTDAVVYIRVPSRQVRRLRLEDFRPRSLLILDEAHHAAPASGRKYALDSQIYEHYPHLIASIDFIKMERHRGSFLRAAPDLVIVDEAHGAARPPGERQRSLPVTDFERRQLDAVHAELDAEYQTSIGRPPAAPQPKISSTHRP